MSANEHEIGAQLQQAAARFAEGFRKGPWGTGVHRQRQFGLAFRLVHRRPAGLGIGQIEGQQARGRITAAAGGDQFDARRQLLAQGLAQLAGSAGEQDVHAAVSSIGVNPERSRDCRACHRS